MTPDAGGGAATIHNIMCADPARANDRFAFVGVSLIHREAYGRHYWRINVKFAKQYVRTPFSTVATRMMPLIKRVSPHVFGMETNNEGKQAIAAFHAAGIPDIEPITTCGRLSEKKRRIGLNTMDKPYTVQWLARCAQAPPSDKPAFIYFPDRPSDHMRVLQEQMPMIFAHKTPGGKTTYRAMKSRHDDLFMALLMCCHVCRCLIEYKDPSGPTNWEETMR